MAIIKAIIMMRSDGSRIGVSRESIHPGKLLPKQLATGDFSQIYKIC